MYSDWHNDVLSRCFYAGDDPYNSLEGQVSIERLKAAGFDLCGLSLWWNPNKSVSPAQSIRKQLQLAEILEEDGHIRIVRSSADLHSEKLKVVLHLEGCSCQEDGLTLDELYSRGVRSLSLTWNECNSFAGGTGLDVDPQKPVANEGFELVDRCRDLKILVDLSHLNERGVKDLCFHDEGLLIATHANSCTVQNHRRNLADETIQEIACRGGAMGLTLVPGFIKGPDCHVDDLLLHVDHVTKLGCAEVLCGGSDFDGTDLPTGLSTCSDWTKWIDTHQDRLPKGFGYGRMMQVLEKHIEPAK